jgi:hypothetical protein
VKRFWHDKLGSIAPLYAHPRFIPSGIRQRYTAVTSIPILDESRRPKGAFGLLLDPHTGIPLTTESATEASASHASLPYIVSINQELKPAYMVCFDQSYHRRHELSKAEQRERKRTYLQRRGIWSFYYVSHAPFVFMAAKPAHLAAIRRQLTSLGIPQRRFEPEAEPDARPARNAPARFVT